MSKKYDTSEPVEEKDDILDHYPKTTMRNIIREVKYALEFARTGDAIEAAVNSGYYSTRREASQSKKYNQPMESIVCKEVLNIVGDSKEKTPNLVLDRYKDSLRSKEVNLNPESKLIRSYRDDKSLYGYKYKEFLYDIMDDQRVYTKDRLTALELLVKIESGYFDKFKAQRDKPVMIIQDDM